MDTISIGRRSASRAARPDLPLAVGPSSAYATGLAPARDVEDRAGDVRRLVGGEPEDRARDLFRAAGARERRARADALGPAGLAARSVNFGQDHARADRIHADALAADFLGEAEREGVDCALGRGVIDVHARAADARRHRREVDDRASWPAVAPRHATDRFARAIEAAEHVDREHPLQALGAPLVDARHEADYAGVVHQHADASELPVELLEQAHHVGFLRHVTGQSDARDLAREGFGRLAVTHIVDGHAVAALGGEARGRGADAASAARDEHHLVHQRPRRNSLSRSASVSWYQVGRPWLQLPERSVSSISRSSAFISGTASTRCARTAAWQAMVASSSFWRAESIALAPYSRISLRRSRASAATSPPASSTGAERTVSSFGPDTATSSPTRSSAPRFSSAVAASRASTASTAGTSRRWRATSPESSDFFRRSMTM